MTINNHDDSTSLSECQYLPPSIFLVELFSTFIHDTMKVAFKATPGAKVSTCSPKSRYRNQKTISKWFYHCQCRHGFTPLCLSYARPCVRCSERLLARGRVTINIEIASKGRKKQPFRTFSTCLNARLWKMIITFFLNDHSLGMMQYSTRFE